MIGCGIRVIGDRKNKHAVRHQRQRPDARKPNRPSPIRRFNDADEPDARVDRRKNGDMGGKIHAIVEAAIGGVFAIGGTRPTWRHRDEIKWGISCFIVGRL
jgi:hypothetical protein